MKFILSLFLITTPVFASSVTLRKDKNVWVLSNDSIEVHIHKKEGRVRSIKDKTTGTLLAESGYWSFSSRGRGLAENGVPRVVQQTDGFVEIAISIRGEGPETIPVDGELRYAMDNTTAGVYVSAQWSHRPEQPVFTAGEGRYVVKLNRSVFDWLTIDNQRSQQMPVGPAWDSGIETDMKEVRKITQGPLAGRFEHKYDYSAVLADTPVYGWTSTKNNHGLWIINPSTEYISGGPTKPELTGHVDVNRGGNPVLLNMWLGSHYGGSIFSIPAGKPWKKCIGPFLILATDKPKNIAWQVAQDTAAGQRKQWPYGWAKEWLEPRKAITGKLTIKDPLDASLKPGRTQIGLTNADFKSTNRSGEFLVDWQRDAQHYQYWIDVAADGRFTIPHVRPGKYTLRAIADGVIGEYTLANVAVNAEGETDIGHLIWKPVRYGPTLWQIGHPDRTAKEFRHGDHFWQWGLFKRYPKEFPNGVNFTIGKSDASKDWNYCQPPIKTKNGIKSSTWKIQFTLEQPIQKSATLRLGIAGARCPRGIQVSPDGKKVGETGALPDTGVMHRDGIRGAWCERIISLPKEKLTPGNHELSLHVPSTWWVEGLLYDYVCLEGH